MNAINIDLIKVARNVLPADTIFKNAKIIDVITASIYEANVAVFNGVIAGVGNYNNAKNIVDLKGKYLSPAFINSHCHVESSMASPSAYCMEEIKWGVTTLITDPHEIANVSGINGIEYMLNDVDGIPINYYIQVPSCVPATPFENTGSVLDVVAMEKLLKMNGVLGMGEVMNVPAVLNCNSEMISKIELFKGKPIDGHSPMISGFDLQGYVAAGIKTDHEATTWLEAKEKLRAGMSILVREGSACKNLDAILKGVLDEKADVTNIAFCTDDKHLSDIRKEGTIKHCIEKAIKLGINPIKAIQMATINAARIYGLQHLGSITVGKQADFVVLENIETVKIVDVYFKGNKIEKISLKKQKIGNDIKSSVKIKSVEKENLSVKKPKDGIYKVIKMIPHQITTDFEQMKNSDVKNGIKKGDICKIAVVERHKKTGNIGTGFLKGYGLKNGTVATTVAHDSHNMIVVGTNDEDMLMAISELERVQGGYTLVKDKKIIETLPLPIAGLMSNINTDELINRIDKITKIAYELGVSKDIDPFITLSFMALPVIPKIRITDLGLFDVENLCFIK